jgi:hypothetical protein
MLQWSFFGTSIRHEGDRLLSVSYSYTKTYEDQSWPYMGADLTKFMKEVRCRFVKSKFHCIACIVSSDFSVCFRVVALDVGRIYMYTLLQNFSVYISH